MKTEKIEPANKLTKREYFAICAMQGLLANECLRTVENIEECSVNHADRLIEALNKEKDQYV